MQTTEKTDLFQPAKEWSLISKHGFTVLILAVQPAITRRALAEALGITPRHVTTILSDLQAAGMLHVERAGRANRYRINPDAPLKAGVFKHLTIGHFVGALRGAAQGGPLVLAAEGGGVAKTT